MHLPRALTSLVRREPIESFEGVVRSIGWGVYVQDGSGNSTTDLLPSISETVDWVRLPQGFAVRIRVVGKPPVQLRIGQTVYASMMPIIDHTEASKVQIATLP